MGSEDEEQCGAGPSEMLMKREEIEALYGRYESQKLPDVPKLIAKYGEDVLLMMVRKKFREQEASSEFPVHSAIVPNGVQVQPRQLAATGKSDSEVEIDVTMGMETGAKMSPARSAPNSVPTNPSVVRPLKLGTGRRGSISSPIPSQMGSEDEEQFEPKSHRSSSTVERRASRRNSVDLATATYGESFVQYSGAHENDFAAPAIMMETDPTAKKIEPEPPSMKREEIEALYRGTESQKLPVREEIEALYGRHESQKLPDVPKLIAKYGEDAMLMMVRKKFREQEASSEFPVHTALRRIPS